LTALPFPQSPPAERSLLFEARPPVALYIHVPFCISVCPYCDFVVYPGAAARGGRNLIGPLVDALVREIELRSAEAAGAFGRQRPRLGSVYLGGGTPSLLTPTQVGRLLEAADRGSGIAPAAEVTLEANPGPGEHGDLAGFRAAGVTRLSVGAQSMQPTELRAIARRHSPADVAETVRLARRAGIGAVSLDLLFDLPGQTPAGWRHTLEAVLALEPDHISAYALTLDDPDAEGLTGATGDHLPLRSGARRWRRAAHQGQDEDRAAACYRAADAALAGAGLNWYEISSWARPGYESRHNLAYWRGLAYEAVGPGAHSYDGGLRRRWNAARLDAYLAALTGPGEARLPPGGHERLDPATAAADRAILRLRLREGLDRTAAADPALAAALAWARRRRLLETNAAGSLRLTMRGRLLADELFVRLLAADAVAA
jgi:putative oxygen-independent coproporphyrinogen III oxidase